VLWRDAVHGDTLHARYHKRYGQDADDDEQDASAADGFEKAPEDEEGGEREGQHNNDRDGEKEGQEKDDPREKEDEDGEEGEEGEASPTHAELLQRKYRLAKAYFDELDENEQEEVQKIREADYQERRSAHDRMLHGETASIAEELASRSCVFTLISRLTCGLLIRCRQHAKSISQGALDGLCTQMQCKGVLILGEIIEGDAEVFISMSVAACTSRTVPNLLFLGYSMGHCLSILMSTSLTGLPCAPKPSFKLLQTFWSRARKRRKVGCSFGLTRKNTMH
jgi:hypothetical protein